MPRKQPTHLCPKDVASHAYKWNRAELEEMRAIVDALMEASKPEPQAEEVPAGNSQSRGTRGGGYFEEKMINTAAVPIGICGSGSLGSGNLCTWGRLSEVGSS